MILGSLPFVIFIQFIHGQKMSIFRDDQIKLFIFLLLFVIFISLIWVKHYLNIGWFYAFRLTTFNITSILTGTGRILSPLKPRRPFGHSYCLSRGLYWQKQCILVGFSCTLCTNFCMRILRCISISTKSITSPLIRSIQTLPRNHSSNKDLVR